MLVRVPTDLLKKVTRIAAHKQYGLRSGKGVLSEETLQKIILESLDAWRSGLLEVVATRATKQLVRSLVPVYLDSTDTDIKERRTNILIAGGLLGILQGAYAQSAVHAIVDGGRRGSILSFPGSLLRDSATHRLNEVLAPDMFVVTRFIPHLDEQQGDDLQEINDKFPSLAAIEAFESNSPDWVLLESYLRDMYRHATTESINSEFQEAVTQAFGGDGLKLSVSIEISDRTGSVLSVVAPVDPEPLRATWKAFCDHTFDEVLSAVQQVSDETSEMIDPDNVNSLFQNMSGFGQITKEFQNLDLTLSSRTSHCSIDVATYWDISDLEDKTSTMSRDYQSADPREASKVATIWGHTATLLSVTSSCLAKSPSFYGHQDDKLDIKAEDRLLRYLKLDGLPFLFIGVKKSDD